jgi:glycosyltransferase involved in cell wall biosynthesis
VKIIAVVYALNEREYLPRTLEILNDFKSKGKISNIVLVNDGSIDNTIEIAKKAGVIVISHKKNLGKRQCFITGATKAHELKADVMLSLDADITQFPETTFKKMIDTIKKGHYMVIPTQIEGRSGPARVQSSAQRAILMKAIAPLFAKNKKWLQYLTRKPKNKWGLEVALMKLISKYKLITDPITTAIPFRANPVDGYSLNNIRGKQAKGRETVYRIEFIRKKIAERIKKRRRQKRAL